MSAQRSRLAGFASIDQRTPTGRPAKEVRLTFAPGRDDPYWHVAVLFEKDLTVQEVAERLRGMADLILSGEIAYGNPVLTVGGH